MKIEKLTKDQEELTNHFLDNAREIIIKEIKDTLSTNHCIVYLNLMIAFQIKENKNKNKYMQLLGSFGEKTLRSFVLEEEEYMNHIKDLELKEYIVHKNGSIEPKKEFLVAAALTLKTIEDLHKL